MPTSRHLPVGPAPRAGAPAPTIPRPAPADNGKGAAPTTQDEATRPPFTDSSDTARLNGHGLKEAVSDVLAHMPGSMASQEEWDVVRDHKSGPRPKPAWLAAARPPARKWRSATTWWKRVLFMAIPWGPRRMLWFWYELLRLYKLEWIPVPRTGPSERSAARANREWLYHNRMRIKQIVMVYLAKPDGDTTTFATLMAAYERITCGHDVLLCDLDSRGGQAYERFGLDRDKTITSDEIAKIASRHEYDWLPQPSMLHALVAQHEDTGVMVTFMPKGTKIHGWNVRRALTALSPTVGSIYVDTTPGFEDPSTAGAAYAAPLVILPGHIHVEADMVSIQESLDTEKYKIRKDHRYLIVIESVRRRDYNLRTVYRLAERFDVDPDCIVLVPYDKWLRDSGYIVFDRDTRQFCKLRLKTRYALSELMRRRGELALEFNREHPIQTGWVYRSTQTNTTSN